MIPRSKHGPRDPRRTAAFCQLLRTQSAARDARGCSGAVGCAARRDCWHRRETRLSAPTPPHPSNAAHARGGLALPGRLGVGLQGESKSAFAAVRKSLDPYGWPACTARAGAAMGRAPARARPRVGGLIGAVPRRLGGLSEQEVAGPSWRHGSRPEGCRPDRSAPRGSPRRSPRRCRSGLPFFERRPPRANEGRRDRHPHARGRGPGGSTPVADRLRAARAAAQRAEFDDFVGRESGDSGEGCGRREQGSLGQAAEPSNETGTAWQPVHSPARWERGRPGRASPSGGEQPLKRRRWGVAGSSAVE